MPIGTAFLRIFAALVLSIPFFLGSIFYLGVASADDTVLTPTSSLTPLKESTFISGSTVRFFSARNSAIGPIA
jgi:hypothetical protein